MAGTKDCKNIYIFDPTKKVTRIECIIYTNELFIAQINFFHNDERLVQLGHEDLEVKIYGGRREVFEIAGDEKLIGCELDHNDEFFRGVTWLKMKLH